MLINPKKTRKPPEKDLGVDITVILRIIPYEEGYYISEFNTNNGRNLNIFPKVAINSK